MSVRWLKYITKRDSFTCRLTKVEKECQSFSICSFWVDNKMKEMLKEMWNSCLHKHRHNMSHTVHSKYHACPSWGNTITPDHTNPSLVYATSKRLSLNWSELAVKSMIPRNIMLLWPLTYPLQGFNQMHWNFVQTIV